MNMIITILGWITAAIIMFLICYWIYDAIYGFIHWKIKEIKWKGIEEFAQLHRSHADWLHSGDRKPFCEFYEYIFKQMKDYAHLSGEGIRNKVDEIIKGQSIEQLKSE